MPKPDTRCFDVFEACAAAIGRAELIKKVSDKDKEYHFQNWFKKRLEEEEIDVDDGGRNSYPDYTLVNHAEGYELKALAYPGREADFDSNSQVPTGKHNGRTVFYVFGRYPDSEARAEKEYPLVDLVICHGDFLNADHTYVHKNKSFRGFGSSGGLLWSPQTPLWSGPWGEAVGSDVQVVPGRSGGLPGMSPLQSQRNVCHLCEGTRKSP